MLSYFSGNSLFFSGLQTGTGSRADRRRSGSRFRANDTRSLGGDAVGALDFFINLGTVDGDFAGSFDAELHLVAVNSNDDPTTQTSDPRNEG